MGRPAPVCSCELFLVNVVGMVSSNAGRVKLSISFLSWMQMCVEVQREKEHHDLHCYTATLPEHNHDLHCYTTIIKTPMTCIATRPH